MRVVLNYFKQSGKWYSEGEYNTKLDSIYDIWQEVREMFRNYRRPGLVDGEQEFDTLIEIPEHPHNHLHIIRANSL